MKFYNSFNEIYSAGKTKAVYNSQKLNWVRDDGLRDQQPGEMSSGCWGFEVYDDNQLETPEGTPTYVCTVADSKVLWDTSFAGRIVKDAVADYCNKMGDVQIETVSRSGLVLSRRLDLDEKSDLADSIDMAVNG